MGKLLKSILRGFGQSLVIYPARDYARPSKGEFRKDATRLRSDARSVGRDLRKKLKQSTYVESAHDR